MKKLRLVSLLLCLVALISLCCVSAVAEEQQNPAIFVVRSLSNKDTKPDNEMVKKMIEEQSGVKFEIIAIPTANWDEKINALIASGEPVDIINISEDSGNWSQYFERHAIVPLDGLLEEYCPNIIARSEESAWKCGTAGDGAVYAIPRQEAFAHGHTPIFRQDWLDALGAEVPKTLEDLEALFEQVKNTDLNGNGVLDEIPYLPAYGLFYQTWRPYFLGFSSDRYLDDNGNVLPWYMHPNCYAMFEKCAEWYAKGYIYPEFVTNTWQQNVDLASAGRLFLFSGWYNDPVKGGRTIKKEDPDNPVAFAALNAIEGAPGVSAWPTNPQNTAELVLSSTAREPEAALKLINWILDSKENWMLANYGIEGVHWDYTDETKTTFIRKEDAADRYLGVYAFTEWFDDQVPQEVYQESDYYNSTNLQLQMEMKDVSFVESFDYYVPYSMIGTEAEMLTNDAETMILEAFTKIVYGEYDEDDWKNVVEICWDMDGQIRSKVWTEQYHALVK